MIMEFLKREIKAMVRFHGSVLLMLLKLLGALFRYALWILPWCVFAMYLWRPALSAWKFFAREDTFPAPVYAPIRPPVSGPVKPDASQSVRENVGTAVRTLERISREFGRN